MSIFRRSSPGQWLPRHTPMGRSAEPGAAMFARVRLRLTLWYTGVLAAALLLFSIGLYIGVQYLLYQPVRNDLAARTGGFSDAWQHFNGPSCTSPPFRDGPPPGSFNTPFLISCYDQHGTLIPDQNTQNLPSSFNANTLVKTVLQGKPEGYDIVYGNASTGDIYRYAAVVPALGGGVLGVVQVGTSIAPQENVLRTLLLTQITLGLITLLGAAFGGLFLANRALTPTREAFTLQQRFIADASHELRTPLTLLRADAEVLLRGREHLAEDDIELLEDIVAETNHMTTLASNMLVLARLDATAQHQEQDIVNMNSVVSDIVQRTTAFAEQMQVQVDVQQGEGVDVLGDPSLLRQAILILLDNAIKYNRQGGCVTVRTALKQGQALIEIQDTGIGIPAEHLEHIGERFYRVDKARSRAAGGTGLGLSIARDIALAHNGTLGMKSELEKGTTASLQLPALHMVKKAAATPHS